MVFRAIVNSTRFNLNASCWIFYDMLKMAIDESHYDSSKGLIAMIDCSTAWASIGNVN